MVGEKRYGPSGHTISRRKFFLSALATSILSHIPRSLASNNQQGMQYRILGSTGEKVSIIGLGGYHMGIPEEAEGVDIVRSAVDSGINFMDNCWDYHDGESERRMGKALRDGYRDRVFLMTKIDGRDYKSAMKQIEDSLKRLQTDRIDLMQVHEVIRYDDIDKSFASGGAIEALVDAKKAGKIRYIGFTGHKSPAIHLKMLEVAFANNFRFDAVQMPLNVMDAHYDSFEQKVLPVLLTHNIGVLAMKPLGSGMILRSGVVTAVECLNYALNLPVSTVITGCDSLNILQQGISAARDFKPLTAAQCQALLEKTVSVAQNGEFEGYKSTIKFDGTTRHPEWLG